MPNIIFNLKFHQYKTMPNASEFKDEKAYNSALKAYNKRQFYSSNQPGGYDFLKYMVDHGVKENINPAIKKDLDQEHIFDSKTGELLSEEDIQLQAHFGVNLKQYTKEEIKEMRRVLRETKSNIWSGIISLTPEYADSFVRNSEDAKKLFDASMKKFLKLNHLPISNIECVGVFHNNTLNPHIHFMFFEKHPKIVEGKEVFSKGKLRYTDRMPNEIEALGKLLNPKIKLDFSTRDKIKDKISRGSQDESNFFMFQKLIKALGNINNEDGSPKLQYARLTSAQRGLINAFIDEIMLQDKSLKKEFEDYKKELIDYQNQRLEIITAHGLTPEKKDENYASDRIKDFYNRTGNNVLREIHEFKQKQEELKKQREEKMKEYEGNYHVKNTMNNAMLIQHSNNAQGIFKALVKAMLRNNKDDFTKSVKEEREYWESKKKKEGVSLIYGQQ